MEKIDFSTRFSSSNTMFEEALKYIPLGSQTFSKSYLQFPKGASPLFLINGDGCKVWDVDGNEYLDFISGLLSVSVGYNDPDVNAAVSQQLLSGVSFSLPHPIELEVAKLIVDTVPCAEMVRFGKNGSDATSGAIRLARAYTGKDHVAVCGYHGWQDWYIGSTTRDLGVPKEVKDLTHKFTYNDIASLAKIFSEHKDQVAAVILEPMNIEYPQEGFLEAVKELAHENNALLVFDETITGFRFAEGGAQEKFGVIPDLATMGKGVANGFPLSIIMGKRKIMELMKEIFYSFTFGGETLSLAAAKAVITKIQNSKVIDHLYKVGGFLMEEVDLLINNYGLTQLMRLQGSPPWSMLAFNDYNGHSMFEIKTLWMQEVINRGILACGTHNITYAHGIKEVKELLTVYDEVFSILANAIKSNNVSELLNGSCLEPVFSVR